MSFSSGAYFGSHSTVSQARSANAAREALLVWIGPLSRTRMTGFWGRGPSAHGGPLATGLDPVVDPWAGHGP